MGAVVHRAAVNPEQLIISIHYYFRISQVILQHKRSPSHIGEYTMAKLAAFDMDGTLLMPDHRLGEKTLSALKRLRERDITLTFATGRHVLEMHHVIGEFSLDAFLITGNGTRIHSLEGEELYRRISLPRRQKRCCTANGIPRPACTSLTMAAGSPARQGLNCCKRMYSAAFTINCAI